MVGDVDLPVDIKPERVLNESMSEDIVGFRRYINSTKGRSAEIIAQTHISAETRDLLKDFVEICRQTEIILDSRSESGYEVRSMQKKFETLKAEHRELLAHKTKMAEIIKNDFTPIIKALTTDIMCVMERAHSLDEAVQKDFVEAGARLRASVRRLIEIFTKA